MLRRSYGVDDDLCAPKTRKKGAVDRGIFGVLNTALEDRGFFGVQAVALVQVFSLFCVGVAPVAASLEAVLQILGAAVVAHRDDSLVPGDDAPDAE